MANLNRIKAVLVEQQKKQVNGLQNNWVNPLALSANELRHNPTRFDNIRKTAKLLNVDRRELIKLSKLNGCDYS